MVDRDYTTESNPLERDQRPWGFYEVLVDSPFTKVKRIIVNPKSRISYQKHFKRQEHWVIVKGTPHLTLNDVVTHHAEGDVIHIPREALHRIENRTDEDVIFIEVQRGSYFGEDDIIRIEDDYNRV